MNDTVAISYGASFSRIVDGGGSMKKTSKVNSAENGSDSDSDSRSRSFCDDKFPALDFDDAEEVKSFDKIPLE